MTKLSDLLKLCEEDEENFPNDPENCEHVNKREKMYCTLCEDCGTVVRSRERSTFNASIDPDGNVEVISRRT